MIYRCYFCDKEYTNDSEHYLSFVKMANSPEVWASRVNGKSLCKECSIKLHGLISKKNYT